MSYTQLTQEERAQIYVLRQQGFSIRKIAKILHRSPSTISREIRRNKGAKGYRFKQAQRFAEGRRRNAHKHIRFTPEVKRIVIEKLELQWSPEQISGWIKKNGFPSISPETIYQFIKLDAREGGQLYKNLRQGHRKRKKRYGSGKTACGQLKNRVSIDQRPDVVDQNTEFEHWEGDTIIGRNHKGAIVTLVERKSKLLKMAILPNRKAETVKEAIINLLIDIKHQVKTITLDNGKEFAHHESFAEELAAQVYFAHPYHSWERGLNENTNGLIRQYFPKKTDFSKITKKEIDKVEYLLNTRPRKKLGYRNPIEVMKSAA